MSNTIFIAPGIGVIPQPDFEARRPTDNGGWEATQSFIIVKGRLDDPTVNAYFQVGRPIKQLDPNADDTWTFLRVRDQSVQTLPNGFQRVIINFTGLPAFDFTGQPIADPGEFSTTFSLAAQTSDAPLSSHPKWKALDEKERNALGRIAIGEMVYVEDIVFDPGVFVFAYAGQGGPGSTLSPNPITSADAVQFALLLMEGESTYRRAGFTWSKRWDGIAPITAAQLAKIGEIVVNVPGSPPTPQSRNWILASANIEQRGETGAEGTVYQNELVFELSVEDGWNQFLYG